MNKHMRRATLTLGAASAIVAGGVGLSGTASAADTGVPVLEAIKQCESDGNYRAENPTSTASGAYQFLTSTWQSLDASGGYATAGSAPESVQDAAALELYRAQGTTPWAASQSCWAGAGGSSTGSGDSSSDAGSSGTNSGSDAAGSSAGSASGTGSSGATNRSDSTSSERRATNRSDSTSSERRATPARDSADRGDRPQQRDGDRSTDRAKSSAAKPSGRSGTDCRR